MKKIEWATSRVPSSTISKCKIMLVNRGLGVASYDKHGNAQQKTYLCSK